MKITETITRECCDYVKDLVQYNGERIPKFPGDRKPLFCKHCGQLWWITHAADGDSGLTKIQIKDWD